MSTPPAYIFLHVPKCAGSTISRILERKYPPSRRFKPGLDVRQGREELKSLPADKREEIDLLYGHVSYGWHEHLPRPAQYVTMIRHPVSRVVSHYNYVRYRTESPHYLRETVRNRDMSIGEYVSSGVCDEMNNGQVRLLAGVEDIVQEPFGESVLPYGTNDDALLDRALDHVDTHFAAVGIQEQFDKSLLLIFQRMNLDLVSYRARNIGQQHYEKRHPTDEEIETILEYNQLDLRLYETLRDRFAKEVSTMAFPEIRTRLFRLQNQVINRLRTARRSLRDIWS